MTNIMSIFFLTTCFIFKETFSLELTKVIIPTYKFHGETALLECQYELSRSSRNSDNNSKNNHNRNNDYGYRSIHSISNSNNGIDHLHSIDDDSDGSSQRISSGGDQYDEDQKLYSVKWYKDNEEFYRYVPKANPPQQSYRVEGIRVDHQSSNDVKVMLKRLNLKSSGLYRCEISAEAPNFSSVEGEGRMEVVYLPRDGPHITGEQSQYQIGDTLNINCTSGKSHPSSTIEWFINDEPVYDSSIVPYPPIVHSHGLITTILGLHLVLDSSHFQNGSMRVKCLTSVSPVIPYAPIHSSSSDGSAAAEARESGLSSIINGNRKPNFVQRKPPLAESREAFLLVRNAAAERCAVSKLIVISIVISMMLFKQFS